MTTRITIKLFLPRWIAPMRHPMQMPSCHHFSRWLVLVGAVALVSCATVPVPAPPDYDALFATAGSLADEGRAQAALDTYHLAAAAAPSRKEPWQRIAAINLAAGRPVRALVAAEETLQRDPADSVANEVFIVSGMQIAQEAMQRLLAAGAKHDAADLARARELVARMGQVFGDDALIPDEAKTRYARRAIQQYRAAQAKQLKSRTSEEDSKPRPDPFEVLGGD